MTLAQSLQSRAAARKDNDLGEAIGTTCRVSEF
jgi:hypothetical protein